jgi:hypothetical protein
MGGGREGRNAIHTVNQREANWIGHSLVWNCLLKHVIERKMEEKNRRRSRLQQILNDVKKERRYWNLKEKALDYTLWRIRFGRLCGPIARQTAE